MTKSYMDVNTFKSLTGINLEEDIINQALIEATERLQNVIFVKQTLEYNSANDKFQISTPIADINCDGQVTKEDIEIYEVDYNDYTNPEQDISSHISSFNKKYGYIVLDSTFPTSGKTLVITYYLAKYEIENMKYQLQKLNMLLAVNYLFTIIPFNKLQEGISSWSLNGVSVEFDANTIKNIIENNLVEIHRLYAELSVAYAQPTSLGFDNDDDNSEIGEFASGIPYD